MCTKVLALGSAACSCERNWSSYEFIHSKKRNRLRPDKARKLVYIFSNLRLLREFKNTEYEEEIVQWEPESLSSGEE